MRSLLPCALLAGLVALSCNRAEPTPPAPPPPPSPTTAPTPAPAPACDRAWFLGGVVDLVGRANAGQSVVTADGCSLFDGKLLVRGWPTDKATIDAVLKLEGNCTGVLTAGESRVTLAKRGETLVVTQVRNNADEDAPSPDKAAIEKELGAVAHAARCPAPAHRIDDDTDAGHALAYALAAATLQRLLADGTAPDKETRATMEKLCTLVSRQPDAGVTGPADTAPFAAMSLLMAASFGVFKEAAKTVKDKDPGLLAVQPAARAVLARKPRTNLDGVCATWEMARAVEKGLATPARRKAR